MPSIITAGFEHQTPGTSPKTITVEPVPLHALIKYVAAKYLNDGQTVWDN